MSKLATTLSRREQILAALTKMLEASPGERITTAVLAKAVGVSEAALYRHFASKAQMQDIDILGLIVLQLSNMLFGALLQIFINGNATGYSLLP